MPNGKFTGKFTEMMFTGKFPISSLDLYSLFQKFIENERNFYNSPHVIIVLLKTAEVESQ